MTVARIAREQLGLFIYSLLKLQDLNKPWKRESKEYLQSETRPRGGGGLKKLALGTWEEVIERGCANLTI